MKKLIILTLALLNSILVAQQNQVSVLGPIDSLAGFDFADAKEHASHCKTDQEKFFFMNWAKHQYIKKKYNLVPLKINTGTTSNSNTTAKSIGTTNNTINQGPQPAACSNIDFESNSTAGWTVAGDSQIMSGGTDPFGGFPCVYPGGNYSLRLNDNNTTSKVNFQASASRVITVGASNNYLNLHFALDILNYPHTAAEAAKFKIEFFNSSNVLLACPYYECYYASNTGPVGINNFQTTPGSPGVNIGNQAFPVSYVPWQTIGLDLTAYIGQNITLKVTCDWCIYDYDWAYCYIDADCFTAFNPSVASCGNLPYNLCGPTGMETYTWTAPPLGNVVSNTTCVNATATGVYTLQCTPFTSCAASILTYTFALQPKPTASFNFTSAPCTNSVTCVSTSSTNGGPAITSLHWDWGDGSPNTTINPGVHTYTSSGPKQVKLVVTNATGCQDSIIQTINIIANPAANFTVNSACAGSAINFTNTTPPGTNTYTWDYGNASTSNAASPSYNYANSGTYTVTLFVANVNNCIDSIKKVVNVYGRAVVNFTPSGVCFGAASNFQNLSTTTVNPNTGGISTYSWSFGNGGTATVQNPVYTYTNIANQTANTVYNVWLYVTTVNGCKDSLSKPVTVYSLPSPDFVADSVCMGSATTLNDLSNNNGNPFFLFSWDFNGDNVSDLANNTISSTNTFTNWGNTAVTYTVFTSPNAGLLICSDKITKNVWVYPTPAAAITYTNKCIDAQPNLMSGISSTLAVGTITNYAWNYGNGNNNLINPLAPSSFSYNTAGNYVVTLTVTSSGGCSNIISQNIDVWERPYANFSYSRACAGKQITLKGNQLPTSGPISAYDWDLNNTVTSTEASGSQITYTYNTPGSQAINLLITSTQGCKNIVPGNIYINYNPQPKFYAPKRAGCADLCINILDSTQAVTGPAKNATWEWNFGNGYSTVSNSSGNAQYVCFANPSNLLVQDYDIKLIVRTDSGCVDSVKRSKYIRVYPNPKADFEWVGKDGDLLTPFISFQNTSIGYNKFYWYYNDGVNITDSSNQNPTHYYNTDIPRNFNVFLAVKNQYGCKDTISKYVDIGPEYTFYIPNTFTPNQDGVNESFTGTGIGIKGFKMWIYDRWGEKLFYTEDIKTGWDGTIKGKQDKEKLDVYTYRCIVKDLWNKEHEYVGHVTLLK